MKFIKLTVIFSVFLFGVLSCERRKLEDNIVENNNIVMSGGQEVPANQSTATGKIEANYNKITKTLSYRVTWSGLSGNVTGMHIHGATDPGFNAGILQSFSGYPTAPAGTYNNSVVADGQVIKEEDILAGKLYVNIHTALYPGGEIRGQLSNWRPIN